MIDSGFMREVDEKDAAKYGLPAEEYIKIRDAYMDIITDGNQNPCISLEDFIGKQMKGGNGIWREK